MATSDAGARGRILCLGDPARVHLPESLSGPGRMLSAATAAEALQVLARGDVRLVVAEPTRMAELLALSEHDVVLDALAEGVAICDLDGPIRWSNRAFRELGPGVAELVMTFVQKTAEQMAAEGPDAPAGGRHRHSTRESTAAGIYCDIHASAIVDAEGRRRRMVAVALDRTAQVRLQQRIGAIEEAGRRLLHLEPETVSHMTPDQRLAMLQKQIINLTRNLLQYDHFRIRLHNPETNRLELVLTEGRQDTHEARELFAERDGSGITGYVAATGQPYICNDVGADPRYLPWLPEARSSLTVPLWRRDKVVGTFNVESEQPGGFGQQDLQALEIFSHYVAQALVTLQLLIAEKVSTTDQLAADVTGELDEPLADILHATEKLRANYVGYDSETLRQLDRISSAVDRIRRGVRQVTDAKRPVTGNPSAAARTRTPLADRRILVADDEPNIRTTLSEVFGALGAAVDLARDGQEAIDMVRARAYDLVLADIRMPQKSGYEVFAAARETHPEVPVVLMTAFGYDPSHSLVRANEEGLDAILFKPFKIQVLYETVGEALGIEIELSV